MTRLQSEPVLATDVSMPSPAPSSRIFTRRSRIAISAGFVVAAAAMLVLGPQLGSVFAEDSAADFWRAEAARKAAVRAAAVRQAPAAIEAKRSNMQAQLPAQAHAYAPTPQRHKPANIQNPFWFFNQPGGPTANLSMDGADPHLARLREQRAQTKPARNASAPRAPVTPHASRTQHVCVRLCDGYFFPAPAGAGPSDAACAAVCPNAPTRLYSMRTDRITDAVSTRDRSGYSRLPVALHYTKAREQTCSCGAPDARTAILSDKSLRRGDRYMTDSGFLIYQGSRGGKIQRRDFTSVAQTRGLPHKERNLLLAIERVSVARPSERMASAFGPGKHVALGPSSPSGPPALR